MKDTEKTKEDLVRENQELKLKYVSLQESYNNDHIAFNQAELELQRSNERWQFAIEGSNDGIWDWNILTDEVFYSDRFKEMIGYGPKDFISNISEWQNRVHPNDIEEVILKLKRYIDQKTSVYSTEHRLLCKDGSWKWILGRGKVLEWTADKKAARIVGTFTDITERKLTEEQLNESIFQYEHLTDAGPALLWMSGTDKLCNYFNKTWLKFTGRNLEQEIGNGWAEGVHPEDFARCLDVYITAFNKRLPFEMEYRLRHSSGEYRWLLDLGTPNFNRHDEFIGYIGHCFDITQRKQSELALSLSEEKYRSIFESVQEVYFENSLDGIIIEISPSIEKFTKGLIKRTQIIGQAISNLYVNKDDSDIYLSKLLQDRRVNDYEFELRNIDGSIIIASISSALVYNTGGNPIKITGIMRDVTERKKTEKTLNKLLKKQNETNLYLEKRVEERTHEYVNEKRRLADILKGTNVGTWEWNIQTGEIIFNERWAEILGYTLEKILPLSIETWIKFYHPDDFIKSREILDLHFSGQLDYYSFESRMKHKNGHWAWVLERGRVHIWDNEGIPLMISGTTQDITKRKKHEAELQWNKTFLELMSNSSPFGLLVVDNKTDDIMYFNNRFCEIWEIQHIKDQMQRGEFKNNDIIPYCLPVLADIPAFAESCKPLQDEANRIELEDEIAFTENRTIRRFTTQMRSENDEYFGRFYIFEDITERKLSEEALKESESKFSLFMDYLPVTVFMKDHLGKTIYINKYMEEAFGASAWMGKTILEVFPNEIGEQLMADDLISIEMGYRKIDESMMHPDGNLHYYETQKFSINRLNHESWLGGISLDITDRKLAEEEILKAKNEAEKANLAKSEFLSRMSHELRTPMNSILGFAQLMEMGELTQKQRKGVNHILNNGKHLLELINEVLDISVIEAGRQMMTLEPVQLAGIINEITESIQMAANKRNVSVEFIDWPGPANSLFAFADKLRLKQILINLLNNAIKYNIEGGSVAIKTALQPSDEKGNTRVRISIIDSGNGIDAEDIEKLFLPFERIGGDKTEIEGTGLGLMVVKILTEAMDGEVGVESEYGSGSTFWIELPTSPSLQPEIFQKTEGGAPEFEVPLQTGTILYIEDNLSNIELVEAILMENRPGIRLLTSIYGMQTVRLAKENNPCLILLDLHLPDIKGIEVLNQLLADAQTKSIPVIIVSADAMPFQVEKMKQIGVKDYFPKPLDVVNLLQSIDFYIDNCKDPNCGK